MAIQSHERLFKAVALINQRPDVVVIGNSKADFAIDPQLFGERAYNASVRNAQPKELLAFARAAVRSNPNLERLIVVVDYEMFAIDQESMSNFDPEQLSADHITVKNFFGTLLTTDALADSLSTVKFNRIMQRDFPASVREIVRSGCIAKCGLRPYYNKQEKALAEETMSKLGISELAGRCYRELSGGQQQRVLLSRALCAAQKILLLDEPVTGLDPKAQTDMYALIEELNKSGITVIMVSHDFAAATAYASRILHIGAHRQLFFGTTADYLASGIGNSFSERTVGEDVG